MNLIQFLLILKARKGLIFMSLLLTVLIVGTVSALMPKLYTATASLVVNLQGPDPVTGVSMPSQLIPGYLATQVDIISSHNVALKVVDNLKLAPAASTPRGTNPIAVNAGAARPSATTVSAGGMSARDRQANILLKNLDVQPSRESSVLYVTYKSRDPQTAARIANAFVQAYIQTNLELKTQPARQTASWYDEQLGELRNNLAKAQAKLSDYQQRKGIVSLDDKLDTENARLAELSTQLVTAQAQTFETQSQQSTSSNASPSIVNNQLIQSLKSELARAEAKLSNLGEREGKNYPEYQRTEAEVNSLRAKLNSEIGVALQSLNNSFSAARQRENDLRAALAAQKAKVLALNAERDGAAVLAREVEGAQKLYDQALQRYGQTRLEGHAGQTEVAVLSSAVIPSAPASPRLGLNLALAVFLGALLGIGLALLREMTDRRVRSAYDLVAVLGAPVLGVLVGDADTMRRLPRNNWLSLPAAKPA
ncbi:MAG: chain length determinant protein EpsF [Burkholderiales bacterium]